MSDDSVDGLRQAIQVWLARPEPWTLAQLTERYAAFLSEDERQRCQRFHFEHDRKHFLAAHAMLRQVLAHYLRCAPHEVKFLTGPNGKPQLAQMPNQPPDQPLLRFNLSHTRGMVACAVTLERDCGIDVEGIRSMTHLEGIAETVFSAEELKHLAAAGKEDAVRLPVFFKLWTLKEAYIKATGLGMSAPLKRISIDPESLGLQDDSRPLQEARHWAFDSWMPAPNHALSLACHGTVPLREIIYREIDLADGNQQVIRSIAVGQTSAS